MVKFKAQSSTKHVAIDKTNAQMVAVVAVAAFVTVFSLVAANSVWSQTRYQAKVVAAKETANKQLKTNISAFNTLSSAYKGFDSASVNVIGGNAQGSNIVKDGSNSKLVLDSLPSAYDFPGLTSSLEKVLADRSLHVTNITGTDDQLNQQSNIASPTPSAVNMPFSFSVGNATYAQVNDLIKGLQLSIRPIQIDTLTITGGNNDMTVTVNAHTYYQPAKNLTITKKVIK